MQGQGSDGRQGGPPPKRRMPPPDHTGREAEYLLEHKDARTPIVVELLDGERFRGVIEYYDRDMIKLTRDDGPNVFIRKVHIRYLEEIA